MFEDINEHSLAYIALTKWAPPLITIVIGGLFASILFPRWQARFTQNKVRAERKLEVFEDVSRWASRYQIHWRRLIDIARYEEQKSSDLSEDEQERKRQFIEDRNNARLELLDSLCRAELYFSDQASTVVERFREWDSGLSNLRLAELPNKEVFRTELTKLVRTLSRELKI